MTRTQSAARATGYRGALRRHERPRGHGRLTDVDYFGGYYSGTVRWGSGRFSSGQQFLQGFTPEPNVDEQTRFAPVAARRPSTRLTPDAGRHAIYAERFDRGLAPWQRRLSHPKEGITSWLPAHDPTTC